MAFIGQCMIYVIMFCAFLGALASIFKKDSELGKAFLRGVETLGTIFLPVAGIMALAPVLTGIITHVIAPLYAHVGADPAMAATTFIAVDMGGYQLAYNLAASRETWMMAMCVGYMAGATIVFTIPIALKVLKKEDYPCLAFGTMAGFISIPIGVFVASMILWIMHPTIRDTITTNGIGQYELQMNFMMILQNLLPLFIICSLMAFGLYKRPKAMMQGFEKFGAILNGILKFVFVLCAIEHFTQMPTSIATMLHIPWLLDPIVADGTVTTRALESVGYISMMLCGAFPMVYLIQTKGKKPLAALSRKLHISEPMITGLVACCANVLALLALVERMSDEDKVKTLSFAVGCAFLLGDHLAFTANFQPTLILPIMLGKLSAGLSAIWIAKHFIVPILYPHVDYLRMDGENLLEGNGK